MKLIHFKWRGSFLVIIESVFSLQTLTTPYAVFKGSVINNLTT